MFHDHMSWRFGSGWATFVLMPRLRTLFLLFIFSREKIHDIFLSCKMFSVLHCCCAKSFTENNNNVESEQDKNSEIKKKSALKTISILHILAIPSIWFSFVTFIVATVCNGFLSINLEPKVSININCLLYWNLYFL